MSDDRGYVICQVVGAYETLAAVGYGRGARRCELRALRHRDKSAAARPATGEVRGYGELDDRSNQIAQLLHEQGLRSGDHVATYLENCLTFFDVCWARLRSDFDIPRINAVVAPIKSW